MDSQEFFAEISLARDFMGSTKTSPAQWDALTKRLAMLAIGLDAPADLRYIAESQLQEATLRRMYLDMKTYPDKEVPR